MIRTIEDTNHLMEVAQGHRPAHLAVTHGQLLNVYTGEILNNTSVCIWGRWIAYVGPDPSPCIGEETQIIDAQGQTLIPGLIDGHTHMAWLSTPEAFLRHAMVSGTTTIVTETMEPYPVAGLAGVLDFLESLRSQPIKIFATAPAMGSISKACAGILLDDLHALIQRDDIIGLGEAYWQSVLQDPDRYLHALRAVLQAGKVLEGHSAGANEKRLMAYVSAGISSCHEPIKPHEVMDRLRLGLHVMIREGSIRRDLEAISEVKDCGMDLRRLLLVSDGIAPGELMEKGYMDYVVQKAIDCGFDPIKAVQMATLNVAEHFRMDHLLGGIAPGRFADLVIIPDVKTISPELVISNGEVIAEHRRPLVEPRCHPFSDLSRHTIRLTHPMCHEDFSIPVPNPRNEVRVRVMEMVTPLVTKEEVMLLPVHEGQVMADPDRDILKVAAIDRTLTPGKRFVGLVKGFGMKSGAFACSAAWDSTDIIVVGAHDEDMAISVNRVAELQGGAVLVNGGIVLEELPLPIFGLMWEGSLQEIQKRLEALRGALHCLGVVFPDPLLSLITLTGAAIPFLRICEEGLVNLKDGKTVGLFLDE